MHSFAVLFIAFFSLSIVVKLWLAQRHLPYIQKNRPQVPARVRAPVRPGCRRQRHNPNRAATPWRMKQTQRSRFQAAA